MVTPEKSFETKIKRYLESIGIYRLGTAPNKMKIPPIGYYTKRWGGGVFTPSGLPDLQIVVHGKCIEVEIKQSSGKPSEMQLFMLDQINKSGGQGILLYPHDFEKFKEKIHIMT